MSRKILLFLILLFPLVSFTQLTEKDAEKLRLELSIRVNNLRIEKGLKPLLFSDTLKKAAEFHSDYMAKNDLLGHDQKQVTYATPKKRVLAFEGRDFDLVGENVLYSTPQVFPLKQKDISVLADEMFTSWKNSPGHYANMVEPEYVFGDFGFETNLKKRIVFATQVFGTKGHIVQNQISNNSFGLVKAPSDCEKEFDQYSNLVLNLGNSIRIEGNEVILYYHDIHYFKEIFAEPNDGIAIDLVSKKQLECNEPNQLDLSPIYDGILLKPFFSTEMLQNNRAESDYRVITKVGDIPENFQEYEYSASMILIKNGKACKYIYPSMVPNKDYELRPFAPIVVDEPAIELVNEGVVKTQIINYEFKTNITKADLLPKIEEFAENIHSIRINSYSSIEGDSIGNEKLHNDRANFIKNHISSTLGASPEQFTIDAKENWDKMNFQLNYFEQDQLSLLSHDSIKEIVANRDKSLPWDSLLFEQRKSIAIVNYLGVYNDSTALETLGEFNLRTGVATDNASLVNKALYEMYQLLDFNPTILFEPQIIEFIKKNPKTVGNYAALLSYFYYYDPYLVTDFIHSELNNVENLDDKARTNLLHLYTLVGIYLLDNWDVSSERLSNVIHPLKIEKFSSKNDPIELVLNLQLTFIQYFGQVNDGPNISKSFNFIANHFKNNSLKQEDDVDLALFFNNWSMYKMTLDFLTSRYKTSGLNEDGLFILAQTMNFSDFNNQSEIYLSVLKKALESNQVRWCAWLNNDFQINRNYEIKKLYCEYCQ